MQNLQNITRPKWVKLARNTISMIRVKLTRPTISIMQFLQSSWVVLIIVSFRHCMGWCKRDVTPFRKQWSNMSWALNHHLLEEYSIADWLCKTSYLCYSATALLKWNYHHHSNRSRSPWSTRGGLQTYRLAVGHGSQLPWLLSTLNIIL